MSNFSDHTCPDPTAESSSTALSMSCKIEIVLHDRTEQAQAKQNALAHLAQAQAALQQWRSLLEAEGVRYGAIHTYPHDKGVTRHNFYPATPDRSGKKRRTYVSRESLPYYRAEIARGQQCQQLQQMEGQIVVLMQSAKELA